MNGPRYQGATSVAGRIAAVVKQTLYQIEETNRRTGTYHIIGHTDLEQALAPYLAKEIACAESRARLEEVKAMRERARNWLVAREETLSQELAKFEEDLRHFEK